ncbi:hypothetical protein Vretimale_11132 [Volvox reticuliferus]|uniref:Uncharacterized protein n=1 Tax=Volvox reticuliferus TaxID=1737510 RepID=A0A8J4GGW2_9CHLO|nr:hypothetical protein Vretifemale_17120 [Volvox reticuliferus]GIM06906.1 hypothetical protein Vretimale_11132 [Volvox reticuliferus]
MSSAAFPTATDRRQYLHGTTKERLTMNARRPNDGSPTKQRSESAESPNRPLFSVSTAAEEDGGPAAKGDSLGSDGLVSPIPLHGPKQGIGTTSRQKRINEGKHAVVVVDFVR